MADTATTSVLLNNSPYTTTWSVDYSGNPLSAAPAWTGMNLSAGTLSASSCNGWTQSAAGDGGSGASTSINSTTWASATLLPCSMTRRFYCIQSR